jgi:hypothetical protein
VTGVYLAMSTDRKVALSYAFVAHRGSTRIEYMTVSGTHLVTLKSDSAGDLRPADISAPGAAPLCSNVSMSTTLGERPDDSPARIKFLIACMTVCLGDGINANCGLSCEGCVQGSGAIKAYNCAACAVCAGPRGVKCMKGCLSGCPPA